MQTGFNAKYKMGTRLGEGAFGVVNLCTPKKAPKDAKAVKVLLKSRMTPAQLEASKGEVEIMMLFKGCPEIVQVEEAFDEDNSIFIVMEQCKGGELFDRIVAKEKLDENMAANVVRTVLRALMKMHSSGIVHRDLKPENLLLATTEEDSPLKVADFGCAAKLSNVLNNIVGSCFYIAPEVLRKENYNEAVDMWSLGVITYILLCGVPPFWGNSDSAITTAVKKGNWSFKQPIWKKISPEAKDFITKLLEMNPATRLTAQQAYAHIWLTEEEHESENLIEAVQELKKFNARLKLRAAVNAVLGVGRLRNAIGLLKSSVPKSAERTPPTIEDINRVFSDCNEDLNIADFEKVMKSLGFPDKMPWARLHECFDADGDGSVSREELECGLSQLCATGPKSLQFCFNIYDKDGDGKLSQNEIVNVLQCLDIQDVSAKNLEQIFTLMDANGDGQVTFEEFSAAIESVPSLAKSWLLKHAEEASASIRRSKRARLVAADTVAYSDEK